MSCLAFTLIAIELKLIRYDLLGSSFANSYSGHIVLSPATMSLLQDAEGHHCTSFPAALLSLIQRGAQLLKIHGGSTSLSPTLPMEHHEALHLLHTARSFDPAAWALDLQPRFRVLTIGWSDSSLPASSCARALVWAVLAAIGHG